MSPKKTPRQTATPADASPKRVPRKNVSTANLMLSLEQNAYGFLNQSLRHYRKTPRNVQEWPFALLHIVQSLELLLKRVLETINPILIYKDIDEPSPQKHSVSLEPWRGTISSALELWDCESWRTFPAGAIGADPPVVLRACRLLVTVVARPLIVRIGLTGGFFGT
jgi:hypothetical protein